MPFPRLQKRGPIEALSATHRCGSPIGFHAYKSVAPLKLHRPVVHFLHHYWFPRLQKRGPIEARRRQSSAGIANRFHAYKSVAPLKHEQLGENDLLHIGFHAYKSVAPLKPYFGGQA